MDIDIRDFIYKEDLEGLKSFMKNNPIELNKIDELGYSPLQQTIAAHFEEGAIWLIENETNVSVLDKTNSSALHYAIVYNFFNVFEQIIKKDKSLVNIADDNGNTPLWQAIFEIAKTKDINNIDYRFVDMLLENGGDLHYKNIAGRSSLDFLKLANREDILSHIKNKFPHLIKSES